jgi:hypothetical protein
MSSRCLCESGDRSRLAADLESSEVMGEFLRNCKRDLMKQHAEDINALAQEAQEQIRKATGKERKENKELREQIHQMTLAWTKERKMWETKNKEARSKDFDPNLLWN